jgi:hypothetical protein
VNSDRFDGLVVPLHARIEALVEKALHPLPPRETTEVGMKGSRIDFSNVSPDEYRAEMDALGQQHEMNRPGIVGRASQAPSL